MALKINRGTSFPITVNYSSNGLAGDLTGASVFFTVKKTEFDNDMTDASAVLAKTITTHSDPTNGVSVINIDPSDTLDLDPNIDYRYDIKVKIATGEIYKLDEGTFKVDGSPTNRIA